MMASSETWALIPVKRFSHAKTRLGEVLEANERAALAQIMLRDVLQNLRATPAIDGIAVISADPEAFALARTFGAAIIFDPDESGVNSAVGAGLAAFLPYNRRVVVVPADIPFARPKDFEKVVELLDLTPVVLVPALHDGGTNALAMRSPDLVQPRFGSESFLAHRQACRDRHLACSVLMSEGIGKDIDCPLDIGPYLSSENPGSTGAFLDQLNIAARFGIDDAPAPLRLF
jgi:2-phospho-L-lactate guanylyltransferase